MTANYRLESSNGSFAMEFSHLEETFSHLKRNHLPDGIYDVVSQVTGEVLATIERKTTYALHYNSPDTKFHAPTQILHDYRRMEEIFDRRLVRRRF